MDIYLTVLLLALLSGLTMLIGVTLALLLKRSDKGIVTGVGFAVGMMLLISFLELIPESAGSIGIVNTALAVLFGVIILAVMNYILPHIHYVKESGIFDGQSRVASMVMIGLILHDFPEGFAFANSYIYSQKLGILVFLAIALHNIPEQFAIAAPLVRVKSKAFLFKAAFLAALAEPLGALLGLLVVGVLPMLNVVFMAFAAGAMVYVSLHELVPMARRYKQKVWFVFGMILSMVVFWVLQVVV